MKKKESDLGSTLNDMTLPLIRMTGQLDHISEKVDSNNKHLERLNGRVRRNEVAISWIKGIGLTFSFVISSIIGYFIKE